MLRAFRCPQCEEIILLVPEDEEPDGYEMIQKIEAHQRKKREFINEFDN